MPLGNFTCVLRTHFKEVLDILFSYSLIRKNDVIHVPSYKIWISVGMNDVNNDVLDRSNDIHSCFHCNQMSTYVDNLTKRFRAFRVPGENVFEKI